MRKTSQSTVRNRYDGYDDQALCHILWEDRTQLAGKVWERGLLLDRVGSQSPERLKEGPRHARAAACTNADMSGKQLRER